MRAIIRAVQARMFMYGAEDDDDEVDREIDEIRGIGKERKEEREENGER